MKHKYVSLKFVNSDAVPKTVEFRCGKDAVAPIMDWYGAFYAGDRYTVHVDGVKMKKDGNGALIT